MSLAPPIFPPLPEEIVFSRLICPNCHSPATLICGERKSSRYCENCNAGWYVIHLIPEEDHV